MLTALSSWGLNYLMKFIRYDLPTVDTDSPGSENKGKYSYYLNRPPAPHFAVF